MDKLFSNMEMNYLNDEQLAGFDKYKYNCKDTGFLSIYVMHPFWNWLIQFCPNWIAPNVLTFAGFLFTVITFLIFSWIDYSFYASDFNHPEYIPISKWIFLMGALFIFLAYTLDGIDGKQARKTGTSGPLGELFDHGLDSYSAGFIPIVCYSLFGRNNNFSVTPLRMFFIVWNILLNFFLSHWEKYNTGVLFLPWGYDFSMWGTIILFILTGTGGCEIWYFTIFGGITSGQIFEIILYSFTIFTNMPFVFFNIYKSYQDKTGYMRTFKEAIRPIIPITILFILLLFWLVNSPGDIIERDPRIIYLIQSTIFSNISCRLIVAQMSNTRCEAFNWLFIPLGIVIALAIQIKSALIELILTYFLCIFLTLSHIHYGTFLVRQMCRHFNINCFTIKKQSD